jgi:hypothetical protein
MKKLLLGLALVVPLVACTPTEKGAVIGGASGAAIGAAVAGNSTEGAIVGGAVGAVAGALIGRSTDGAAIASIVIAEVVSIPNGARTVIDLTWQTKDPSVAQRPGFFVFQSPFGSTFRPIKIFEPHEKASYRIGSDNAFGRLHCYRARRGHRRRRWRTDRRGCRLAWP